RATNSAMVRPGWDGSGISSNDCSPLRGAERAGFFCIDRAWGDLAAGLAPAPVLWLAFGKTRGRTVATAAFAAFAIGNTNLLPAYYDVLPMVPLAIGIVVSALAFAGCMLAARLVQRRVCGIAAMIAFA